MGAKHSETQNCLKRAASFTKANLPGKRQEIAGRLSRPDRGTPLGYGMGIDGNRSWGKKELKTGGNLEKQGGLPTGNRRK